MIGKFLNQYNVKNLNKTRIKLEKLFKLDDYDKISLYLYKNKMEKLDKNMLKTKYVNRFILSVMVICLYQCLHILKYKEPNKKIRNFLKYIPLVKFPDKIQENYVNKYFIFSYNNNCYTYLDDYSDVLNDSVIKIEFKFDEINNNNNNNNNFNEYIYMNKRVDMTKYTDMSGYVKMNCFKENNNIYDVPKSVRDSDYQNIEYITNKMLKFNLSFEDLLKESQYDEIPFTSRNYKEQLMKLNRSINNLLIK